MKPPYYAVIFTSLRRDPDPEYDQMAEEMETLAADQPGYLGIESARSQDGKGITVSYWKDLDSIAAWKKNARHQIAQKRGKEKWYLSYSIRIARVEREYSS